MKIAIDISPLESGHKVRGVGFYVNHLKHALEKYFPEHEYTFFTGTPPTEKIDVIHYPYFDPFFSQFSDTKNIPVIVTVHDLTPIKFSKHFPAGIKGKLRWQINKRKLAKVDQIITDSDCSTKDVTKLVSVNPNKVKTIYLASGEEFKDLDISEKEQKLIIDKFSIPEKFMLYVGDVTWNKNLPRLLRSVEKANYPLVLVGKALQEKDFDKTNPWNADRVIAQEIIENSPKIFHPLGFVTSEELVSLYNMADVLLMPSLYEGFGLPVIEAMNSGCPVITSKEGSLSEVGGDSVYYVDAYSEESIIKGIREVINSDKLKKELSSKGKEQASLFSWKRTAEETIKVYQSVTTNKTK